VSFFIGLLLAIGIFTSYLPQHVKILKRRTSEGLSPDFILLGSLSAFSALTNIFIFTIPARECCYSTLTALQCSSSLIGLLQIFLQAFGSILVFLLCIFATKNSIRESQEDYRKLKINYYIFLIYVTTNILFVSYLRLRKDKHKMDSLLLFADFSGIFSTIMSIIQYIPQFVTTFRAKHAGTLSIPMMCLQTPGGYIWSYSLFAQPGSQWSSWLPFFAGANLQMILLSMCLYYNLKYPTKLTEANAELRIAEENYRNTHNSPDETTPLSP
jgi:uncharacterized protein with PQ loop repeat